MYEEAVRYNREIISKSSSVYTFVYVFSSRRNIMATYQDNKQCQRCVHRDVCKYIDVIAEIKTQYAFVTGITCGYCVRRTAENTKPEAADDQVEEKPVPEEKPAASKKQEKTAAKMNGSGDSLTMLDIQLNKLGISDQNTLRKLNGVGVNTLGQLYDYITGEGRHNPVITQDEMKAINGVLAALNQKTI